MTSYFINCELVGNSPSCWGIPVLITQPDAPVSIIAETAIGGWVCFPAFWRAVVANALGPTCTSMMGPIAWRFDT